MRNLEVTVSTNALGSELVADALYTLGSGGVAVYDSGDVETLLKSDVIWDYIDENLLKKSEVVLVKGYYPEDGFSEVLSALTDELKRLAENSDESLGSLETTVAEVDDEDWVNTWRSHYKPIKLGCLTVVPKWIAYEAEPSETCVYIDPGMAFGTGEHETTRMCLTLLQELNLRGLDVLDIGTGSGILGIAAAALGAKSVNMSDLDEIAVESAKSNLKLNDTGACEIEISRRDLLAVTSITGDVILANITADILIRLSRDIASHLRAGGYLIISGIIHMRADEVREAFASQGLTLDKEMVTGEWRGMRFTN